MYFFVMSSLNLWKSFDSNFEEQIGFLSENGTYVFKKTFFKVRNKSRAGHHESFPVEFANIF